MNREGRNRRKRRGRERAVAAAVTAAGGTKGGKGEILLTYTPTSAEVRVRRDRLMRGRVRGKRNDDSGG